MDRQLNEDAEAISSAAWNRFLLDPSRQTGSYGKRCRAGLGARTTSLEGRETLRKGLPIGGLHLGHGIIQCIRDQTCERAMAGPFSASLLYPVGHSRLAR